MSSQVVTIGSARIEVLTEGKQFVGLGKAWIGQTLVRSGRLPIKISTYSFMGLQLSSLTLAGIEQAQDEVRIRLDAAFSPMEAKVMTDHSLDPIHDTGDWDKPAIAGTGTFTIVLKPAQYQVHGRCFEGFSYSYEYSGQVPLYWIMDRASWEIGGDAVGATVYSQSSCSDPVATFDKDTFWTTEGSFAWFPECQGTTDTNPNPVMTHNLPRWASHQAFDFQIKGDATLLGIYDHVDLIRTVLRRDAGQAEIKTFDKHIFDEATSYRTSPKSILLNTDAKTVIDQQNIWTWVFDDVHRRARAEFGLKEQPCTALLGHHYWKNYTIDTFYKDLLPVAANLGLYGIFTENCKKHDGCELDRLPNGNMCCSKEYVISDRLGGTKKLKEYIQRSQQAGVKNFMWTNTYMSLSSQINAAHNAGGSQGWFIAMNDTRIKYAGAYTSVSSNIDLKNPDARKYWVDCHKKIKDDTGIEGFFVDSWYNLFFMPVDFKTGHPRTVWREALGVMKELQDYGIGWYTESFGPFGQPLHGHPASFGPDKMFICYYVGLGNGYTVIPVPGSTLEENKNHAPGFIYYEHAHKCIHGIPLFIDGKRVDTVYGPEHKRVIQEYYRLLPDMHTRFLQEDGKSVIWHNEAGTKALVWNFVAREVALPGRVTDTTTGASLPAAKTYQLQATHTYAIEGVELPEKVG